MRRLLTAALVMVMVLSVSAITWAVSVDKITGDIVWSDGFRSATFSVHAGTDGPIDYDGKVKEPKGTMTFAEEGNGYFVVDYSQPGSVVIVEDNEAWFCGPIVETTMSNPNQQVGDWRFTHVIDNGEPGIGADVYGGAGSNLNGDANKAEILEMCDSRDNKANIIVGGNLQVHSK